MSYTPTEWESTDVVTATRMNALETAVGEMNMSYTPNTWSDGDILSAEKMNALEQAVASGGGGGSSDFSTAEVTIKAGESGIDGYLDLLPILESDGLRTESELYLEAQGQITKTIVLYKGKTVVGRFGFYTIDSMSGNITIDDNDYYIITGDCSVTLLPED